ncbi:TonB-dependent receptor [Porphyromonas pogonae]|uniref:TonB-dependent receptor n=1 Tax=Porphyromonas pogonae TaxID=867595 RepID=UPI002E79EE26|nr:TonB-dependent receptor [Porphyromonas pogonae]
MKYKVLAMVCCTLFGINITQAQNHRQDSIKQIDLKTVTVSANSNMAQAQKNTFTVNVADSTFLLKEFKGNLVQTLENIPGVQSMNIGSGFAKPMIRGLGFNRIAFIENGVKQEGQQWGADHGLEFDPFNADQVIVRKGPSSILFGSDAMGGTIEVQPKAKPLEPGIYGDFSVLAKSVYAGMAGSLKLGWSNKNWNIHGRYTEQHFGDLNVNTDHIVYLTRNIPIDKRRLKNTAGYERDASLMAEYATNDRYKVNAYISNSYQKIGLFPGAHGVPDLSRTKDDGNRYNIELPYSSVNHFKLTTNQSYRLQDWLFNWDIGFQKNLRREWSAFHTHYSGQNIPEKDPDKELEFDLNTYSSQLKAKWFKNEKWKHTLGIDFQAQNNKIAGYSFLLPQFTRFTSGIVLYSDYTPNRKISFGGGLRYDFGKVNIKGFEDPYLSNYLKNMGYTDDLIGQYHWRAHPVNRSFGDWSLSLGMIWNISPNQVAKVNIGHSFRLPGANELSANGVHHGSFRHERGNSMLNSENGWQLDASYNLNTSFMSLTISPFASYFSNYIYLKPSGEWSVLPHAGQIYNYTENKALFAGTELEAEFKLTPYLSYRFNVEYVYTYNVDEKLPLPFSPPAKLTHALHASWGKLNLEAEHQLVADQNRVARNEDNTAGHGVINLIGDYSFPLRSMQAYIALNANNIFNKRYYNHLSFYRKIEIPEPGRNIQLLFKLSF